MPALSPYPLCSKCNVRPAMQTGLRAAMAKSMPSEIESLCQECDEAEHEGMFGNSRAVRPIVKCPFCQADNWKQLCLESLGGPSAWDGTTQSYFKLYTHWKCKGCGENTVLWTLTGEIVFSRHPWGWIRNLLFS